MPAAPLRIFRLGARIGALDGLVGRGAPDRSTLDRFQELTSAVAVAENAPGAPDTASNDDRFVARLALGLLNRGWPALVSPVVEASILTSQVPGTHLRWEQIASAGEWGWRLTAETAPSIADLPAKLATRLATADSRLTAAPPEVDRAWQPPNPNLAQMWDSVSEQRMYDGELSRLFGSAIGLVELQRPLETMAPAESQPKQGPWVTMPWRRADFTLELPGSDRTMRLNVELDGPHHRGPHQRSLDSNRDRVLTKAGWVVIRVPTDALENSNHPALVRLRGTVQSICEADPVVRALIAGPRIDPSGLEALRLLLTPHAVARVQLGVVLAVLNGSLHLDAPAWEIAVVEREVPCAEVALLDVLHTLKQLCRLYDIPFGVERVRLRVGQKHLAPTPVLPTTEFPESIREVVGAEPLLAAGTATDQPDLVLDVAVLARPTQRYAADPLHASGIVGRMHLVLRTAPRAVGAEVVPWAAPRILTPDPIAAMGSSDNAGNEAPGAIPIPLFGTAPAPREPLRYFLQTLFRKREFRPGQLEIIDRALARKDVIGLLPTGAGKSICYQLPALLSPGQTLVVDPIKSLMQDQVDNLATAGILDAMTINSDQGPDQRRAAEAAFGQGAYRFVFTSPERLQIQTFRDHVASVGATRPTAFVVVDEAHCVSEWGHDFRIAYLNLGRLSRDLCVFDGISPPIVALTGTASRTVLVDIQRELQIGDDEAIVSPASFDRPELHFAVESVRSPDKLSRLKQWIEKDLPSLQHLDMPLERLGSGEHGGIVFCPHVNGAFGVYPLHLDLRRAHGLPTNDGQAVRVGFFSGSVPKILADEGITARQFTSLKTEAQRQFKHDQLALLVATKAFGMGIDKPNIRYTVHYGMAESVEAFAQEAGRAGRDRAKAVCLVLFSDDRVAQAESSDPLQPAIEIEESRRRSTAQDKGHSPDDVDRILWLHGQSYAGVAAETNAIQGFYRLFVQPTWASSPEGSASTSLIVAEQEANHQLFQGGWLSREGESSNDKNGNVAPDPVKIDVQRIIYRLSLLGIVADYTIEYGGGLSKTYTIALQQPAPEAIRRHLDEYVARYPISDASRTVGAQFERAPYADPVEKAIYALCWFTYDAVEKQRRADIHTMRQMLRASLLVARTGGNAGEELRRQLNDQLSASHFTATIVSLLGRGGDPPTGDLGLPAGLDVAATLLAGLGGPNDADQLVGQARRYRSQDPDNPALLALVGLGLAHNPRRSPDDAAASLHAAIALLERRHNGPAVTAVARWMIAMLAQPLASLGESTTWALLTQERVAGGQRIARAAYPLVTTPRLKRASALPYLRAIADAVERLLAHQLGREPRREGHRDG